MDSHQEQDQGRAPVTFSAADARCDAAVGAMTAYFEELADRFPEGFDPGDTLVADAGTFDAPDGVFVLMHNAAEVVGCGGVHKLDDRCGEIKRMWVRKDHRGKGLGRTLLAALEAEGRRLGYEAIRLDTNSALTEAISMYESNGYRTIPRYNDNPFARHWFEKELLQ